MSGGPRAVPLDPARLVRVVEQRMGARARAWRPLAEVPGERLVISVDVGPSTIVAKAVVDGSVADVAAALVALAADAPSRSTLVTPRLVFADPARGVVAMTALDGTPYPQISAAADLEAALCRAGVATAELHRSTLPSVALRATTPTDHLAELVRPRPAVLAAALPQWAAVIERALDLVTRLAPGGDGPVPIHRDLHLRQLVRCPAGVGLVDWDLLALGDPALDVASMVTYLETHLGEFAAPATDAYLAGYRAGGGVVDEQGVARYRCFHLLRRACRRFRLQDRGWEAELGRMLAWLDEALRHEEETA